MSEQQTSQDNEPIEYLSQAWFIARDKERQAQANYESKMANLSMLGTDITSDTTTSVDVVSLNTSDTTATIQTSQAERLSILPSIAESERFIKFLNERFKLGVRNDLIINIHDTSRMKCKGYFQARAWNIAKPLNTFSIPSQAESQALKSEARHGVVNIANITLSSQELINEPYETIAHELAHYLNAINGVKDSTINQYHNKKFKIQAEKLGLIVEKDKRRGYAYTKESEAFKEMLKEFEPNPTAFKIFQDKREAKTKGKSRLIKFVCGCGCIIRTARNNDKPLNAKCLYCETNFQEEISENDF